MPRLNSCPKVGDHFYWTSKIFLQAVKLLMRPWLGWSGAWTSGAEGERRFPIFLGHGVCSGASTTVNWGRNRAKGDGSTNYVWEKPGTPCCSHQTVCLNMEICTLINGTHEARAPVPLSTLNIFISPVYIPQRHFPNASQDPLKPSTLFGFLTCARLDRLSITNLLIFCLFVSICSAAKIRTGFFYVTIF